MTLLQLKVSRPKVGISLAARLYLQDGAVYRSDGITLFVAKASRRYRRSCHGKVLLASIPLISRNVSRDPPADSLPVV